MATRGQTYTTIEFHVTNDCSEIEKTFSVYDVNDKDSIAESRDEALAEAKRLTTVNHRCYTARMEKVVRTTRVEQTFIPKGSESFDG